MGRPLAGAAAGLVNARGDLVANGMTDASGTVALTAPAGAYDVVAGTLTSEPVTRAVNTRTSNETTIEITPGAVITAVVTNRAGDPVPGVLAKLYSGDTIVDAGFTNQTGSFRFLGHDAGSYTVKTGPRAFRRSYRAGRLLSDLRCR